MEGLLLELREVIVLKSVMTLFKSLGGVTTPGNDVLALTTVMSVCSDWHRLIAGRHFNRRLLRTAILSEKKFCLMPITC